MRTSELVEKACSGKFAFSDVWSEVREVFEAASWDGVKEETCDVYTTLLLWIYTTYGVDMPMVWERSANKYLDRIKVWERIFADEGLEFELKYIRNGGNHERPEKVAMALALAREE